MNGWSYVLEEAAYKTETIRLSRIRNQDPGSRIHVLEIADRKK